MILTSNQSSGAWGDVFGDIALPAQREAQSRPGACRGGDGLTMGWVNFQCPQRVKIGCSLTPIPCCETPLPVLFVDTAVRYAPRARGLAFRSVRYGIRSRHTPAQP
jgi:hypothetical protein